MLYTISGEDTLELVQEDFSLLSHTSEQFFFRWATPMLSCILLLMYFQNGFELFVWSPWVMVVLMYSALRILLLYVFLMNL